jgi:hypothetical protein
MFRHIHPRACNLTDASGRVRGSRYATDGGPGLLEVLITKQHPTKWEWRVYDRHGTIMGGFESTRSAARYRGNRALFLVLSVGWAR